MKACCVSSLLRWMRRADSRHVDITLSQLFRLSYFAVRGISLNETQLQNDLAEFAKGVVPYYVVLYMHKNMYPHLATYNPEPHPPILY